MVQVWSVPHRLMYWGLVVSWWAFGKWLGPEGSDLINGSIPSWVEKLNRLWEGLETLGGEALLEEIGHWGHVCGASCPGPFLFVLSASRLPWGEQPLAHSPASMTLSLATGPQQWSKPTMNGKTSGTWCKMNPSPFKLFLLEICHRDEKLTLTGTVSPL
jgi:hypothetical protein